MRMHGVPKLATASTGAAVPEFHIIRPVGEAIDSFPSTRYHGSKRKLLHWIYTHVRGIQFDNVLDAFGGTGSVSLLFKAMRKNVTYHDGLRFNEDVGRTVLADELALSRLEIQKFLARVKPHVGLVAKNFDGIFYTAAENQWLDGCAELLNAEQRPLNQSALLRYLVYQACLKKRPFNLFHRSNLHLRTNAKVIRSFGNAATWERSFDHLILQAYDGLPAALKSLNRPYRSCRILEAGNAEDIPTGHDLVYIDPPYTSLQERYNFDDYWRRYHFLEGLARYSDWTDSIDQCSRIKELRPPSWIIEWSRRRTFKDRLFTFIHKHRHSTVVLSYVTDAHPPEDEIRAYFESRFLDVSVHSTQHSHALSRLRKRELLFIGYPRK
jgi:adenine-specific DNA-methyltransferase